MPLIAPPEVSLPATSVSGYLQPPSPGGKGPRQELVGLDWQPVPSRAEPSLPTPGRCSQMMTGFCSARDRPMDSFPPFQPQACQSDTS